MERDVSARRQLFGTYNEFLEERDDTLTQSSELLPSFVPDRIIGRVKASDQGSYLIVVHSKTQAAELVIRSTGAGLSITVPVTLFRGAGRSSTAPVYLFR